MKTVVIGIGNILLGDEGAGVRVIEELKKFELPGDVEVYDGATSGIAILNFLYGAEKAIIVDAVRGGGKPGTVYRFRIDEAKDRKKILSLHDIDFVTAYRVSKDILSLADDIIVIGIEPDKIEKGLELSGEVEKAIKRAVDLVLDELGLSKD